MAIPGEIMSFGVSPVNYSDSDTSLVVPFDLCFGVEVLCCLHLKYVFIILVKFG